MRQTDTERESRMQSESGRKPMTLERITERISELTYDLTTSARSSHKYRFRDIDALRNYIRILKVKQAEALEKQIQL